MVSAVTCTFDGRKIAVNEALRLRSRADADNPDISKFTCNECGQQVRPHRGGGHVPAHFEHLSRNQQCSLSHKRITGGVVSEQSSAWISTKELAQRTAGGDDYIRTKNGVVVGVALRLDLNEGAPEVVVVGKGPRIERRAELLRDTMNSVPTYVKRGTNAWEYLGEYNAKAYRTDRQTIKEYCGTRPPQTVAGILFLESRDKIAVEVRGGGFADAKTRKEIEQAAISFATEALERQGFTVTDRQMENCGYDLHAQRGVEEFFYEVKGTSSATPRFFISRNERACSSREVNWRLAIVISARSQPTWEVMTAEEMESRFKFDCLAWECKLNF